MRALQDALFAESGRRAAYRNIELLKDGSGASAAKKNRIGPAPRRSGLLRCGSPKLGWDRASGCLVVSDRSVHFRSGPRPIFPSRKRQTHYRNLRSSGETVQIRLTKKPLCGNQSGVNRELKTFRTPAPASTLSFRLTSSACLLQQRAGLKGYFANSPPKIAIGHPCVNPCKSFCFLPIF